MKINQQREEWIGSRGRFLIERHNASAMAAAHWHDHVECNLLLEGEMIYLFNGRQQRVEAGRLVMFWAAIPHQTITVSETAPLVCIYLPFVDFLALPIDRDARQAIMQGEFLAEPRQETADAILMPRWEEDWRSGSDTRKRLVVDEVRLRMRRMILDNGEIQGAAQPALPAPAAGQAVRHVELMTRLINEHSASPLSIPDLAKRAGMHGSTANKAFRKVLGISVNEYMTRCRVAKAMQLLADTDDPILQIGFDCGFGSTSRFYELFKERMGITPRQFRESMTAAGT